MSGKAYLRRGTTAEVAQSHGWPLQDSVSPCVGLSSQLLECPDMAQVFLQNKQTKKEQGRGHNIFRDVGS